MSDSYVDAAVATSSMPGAAPAVGRNAAVATAARSRFIVGPLYDYVFFIASPLMALALGIFVWANHLSSTRVTIWGHEGSPAGILIGAFTMSHLFIVFFRSNGNKKIFNLHPLRFTVVPIVLFTLMCGWNWLSVAMGVLATWWDVYHSSLQTFGLGRIYDGRAGNDPKIGRRLDYFLNLLLYAGPILAGATLVLHTKDFRDFKEVNSPFFAQLGGQIDARQPILTPLIVGGGSLFLLFYLFMYWRYYRQGYKVSIPKVLLLVCTGFCSIYTWGFNTFGEAFFIMNFFHAFQYFGIVWWSEKKTMMSLFKLDTARIGKAVTLVLFVGIAASYGLWAESVDAESFGSSIDIPFNAIVVVSLMHFWYDGFIWSVRKRQV